MKFNYIDGATRPIVKNTIAATTTPDFAELNKGGAKKRGKRK